MACGIHESYDSEAPPLPSERSTGLVFAAASMIGAILLRNSTLAALPYSLALISAGFLAASLLAPKRLTRLNVAWFKLALLLNKIVSPVVMAVLFATAIVPFGLAMQLKRDPLRKRRDPHGGSHWVLREATTLAPSMRNQF